MERFLGGALLVWVEVSLFVRLLSGPTPTGPGKPARVPPLVALVAACLLSLGLNYLLPPFFEGYFGVEHWSVQGGDYVLPTVAVFLLKVWRSR